MLVSVIHIPGWVCNDLGGLTGVTEAGISYGVTLKNYRGKIVSTEVESRKPPRINLQ